MKKESFYLQHDYNAFFDPKIRYIVYEHSVIAYAVFWIAIEMLASQTDYRAPLKGFVKGILPLIQGKNINLSRGEGMVSGEDDDGNGMDLDLVGCYSISLARLEHMMTDMIEQGLFATDGEHVWSNSLNKRMEERKEISEKRAEAGRKGGLAKAGYKEDLPIAKQKIPNAKQERKGKERKGNENLASEKKPTTTNEPTKEELASVALEHGWADKHYIDKLWDQGLKLSAKNREEFFRKIRVVLNSSKHPATLGLARKIYFETCGIVNDYGDMEHKISPQEREARALYREEVGQDLSVA
jgi:hypothetical protein